MKKSHASGLSQQSANAQLDALLHKGVLADKRATKPPFQGIVSPPAPVPSVPSTAPTAPVDRQLAHANPTLERLTVRFTQEEARLLEKGRAAARAMGYKISDTAVFRLALNGFQAERMTSQAIEAVLAADGRRRPS